MSNHQDIDDAFLTVTEARALMGMAQRAWAARRKSDPTFPRPRCLAGTKAHPRALRWSKSELLAWGRAQPVIEMGAEPVELARARAVRGTKSPSDEDPASPGETADPIPRLSAVAASERLSSA